MRTLTALALTLALSAAAHAHFLFILPAAGPQPMPVVWSDGPMPDPKAGTDSLTGGVGKKFSGAWAETPLEGTKGEGTWKVMSPGNATILTAKAEYGLVNRGEGHVFLVRYLAKWSKAVEAAPAEPTLTVELTAVRDRDGLLQFRATQGTKPLALADVTVYEPNTGKTRTLKTTADGLTDKFKTPGSYAARVLWKDMTEGEYEGRKYRGTYYYSTLTTEYR